MSDDLAGAMRIGQAEVKFDQFEMSVGADFAPIIRFLRDGEVVGQMSMTDDFCSFFAGYLGGAKRREIWNEASGEFRKSRH